MLGTYPMDSAFCGLFIVILSFGVLLYPIIDSIIHNKKIPPENVQLFRTEDEKEYHSFLENFDETKYEILDVSPKGKSDKFYIITYRTITE